MTGFDPQPSPWRELDDTLADASEANGQAAADVPDEAKAWLAEQRVMHGLLRSLHTADPAAREARIAGIFERIDRDRAQSPRRRWLLVAAAALVLACLGTWWSLPASLPTAEATMQRASTELGRDVDRRFRLVVSARNDSGKELRHHELALVVRPGSHFRIEGKLEFGTFQLGEFHAGCDGSELWMTSMNGAFRHAGPLAERDRLQQRMGDVLDLGYLDVEDLVRRLPDDFELRVVGRETGSSGSRLRIEGTSHRSGGRRQLRSAWLECDEQTGMVTRLSFEFEARSGTHRLELQYLGEEPPGLVDYHRPW